MYPTRTVISPFSASASVIAVIFRVTWYLTLVTLFYSTCVASASITAVRRGWSNNDDVLQAGFARSVTLPSLINTKPSAQKRSATEHVILCDCLSASGIRSSQMAYYSADVQGSPTGGVGIVETEFNTTATWYNATTSATWMDTGVTFKAVIGYHVAEDDYVGKGNNGYGDFRCWQRAKTGFAYDLKGDGNVCEMQIDCNKAVAPSTDPAYVPLESTTTTTGDEAETTASAGNTIPPTSTNTNSAGNAQQPGLENKDKDKVISTGAVIGIAIGIVAAFTFLAGGAGFFFARRRRLRKKQQQEQQRRRQKEARTESTITESYAPGPGSDLAKSPSAVYELDGDIWSRHEMGDDTGHYEIDGQVRCEMDGVDGEIKEKMEDELFADAADAKQIILCLDEKKDSKVILDDKNKGEVHVSEKELEVRRDKEGRERERQQQQQQQQQQSEEEQKRTKNPSEEQPLVSPASPLSPPAWTEEAAGQTPFCLPAIMPETEKFIVEEFRAHNKKMEKREKDEANVKFRFEEETQKYNMKVEEGSQKFMKGDMPSASGKDTYGP